MVDDICDSGGTLERFCKGRKNRTAAIYYRKNRLFKPDYWVLEKKGRWIKFPWEETRTTRPKGRRP